MTKVARAIDRKVTTDDLLAAAKGIAKNIANHEIDTGHGVIWDNDVLSTVEPAKDTPHDLRLGYYFGAPGIALFLAQLGEATGDHYYIEEAKAGVENVIYEIKQAGSALGVLAAGYTGSDKFSAGVVGFSAFDLYHIGQLTQTPEYQQIAEQILDEIAHATKPVDGGLIWDGRAEMDHDQGGALLLIQGAQWFDHPEWIDIAKQVGYAYLAKEKPIGDQGARYLDYNESLIHSRFGSETGDQYYPNFMHGVSGMGYFFSRLFEQTGDKNFAEATQKSLHLLNSLKTPVGEGFLFPYLAPNNPEQIYYLGFCHGAEGTSRFYYQLYQHTGDQQYLSQYEQLFAGIIAAGAPETHSSGYWNNLSLCCGSAGLLHGFLGAWLATGDKRYEEYARRTVDQILGESTVRTDGTYQWYQSWDRLFPERVFNDIGLRSGDAGLGQALLEYWGLLTQGKDYQFIRLPDDPLPLVLK